MLLSKRSLLAMCLVFAATACDDDDDTDPDPIVPAPDAAIAGADARTATDIVDVGMGPDSFAPEEVTITAGSTVRWKNGSSMAHTVTSGVGSSSANAGDLFDAEMPVSGSFEYTFETAGDYPYFCRVHEALGMTGVVHVTP